MTSISLRVVAFLLTGVLLDLKIWLVALFAVPAALLGIMTAQRLFKRISREMLLRAVALLLAATGTSLVWRALS
jgi:uncharacterized membrane protein YfcA